MLPHACSSTGTINTVGSIKKHRVLKKQGTINTLGSIKNIGS